MMGEAEAFGLEPRLAQERQDIRQPFRTVAQTETAAVF